VTGRGSDRGSTSVELVILTPAFGLMLALVLLVGLTQSSRAEIEAAAHAAVRSITLSRDPATAADVAHAATADRLQVGSPSCRSLHWQVDITADEATVIVSCDVDLSEAAFLPVPGVVSVEATATEVFDRFTESSGEFGVSEGSGGSNPSVEVL
jgi:Flp pilus assembly protein TadG